MGGGPIGIDGATWGTRTAADLMRRHFIALAPEDSLLDAERTMRLARVRALPVVSDGRLMGVAAHREVLRALLRRMIGSGRRASQQTLDALRVESLAVSLPPSVPPEASLAEAALELCGLESGCLAVVERDAGGDRMLGLLTESDLLRAALRTPG